jgi:hypothetical protein
VPQAPEPEPEKAPEQKQEAEKPEKTSKPVKKPKAKRSVKEPYRRKKARAQKKQEAQADDEKTMENVLVAQLEKLVVDPDEIKLKQDVGARVQRALENIPELGWKGAWGHEAFLASAMINPMPGKHFPNATAGVFVFEFDSVEAIDDPASFVYVSMRCPKDDEKHRSPLSFWHPTEALLNPVIDHDGVALMKTIFAHPTIKNSYAPLWAKLEEPDAKHAGAQPPIQIMSSFLFLVKLKNSHVMPVHVVRPHHEFDSFGLVAMARDIAYFCATCRANSTLRVADVPSWLVTDASMAKHQLRPLLHPCRWCHAFYWCDKHLEEKAQHEKLNKRSKKESHGPEQCFVTKEEAKQMKLVNDGKLLWRTKKTAEFTWLNEYMARLAQHHADLVAPRLHLQAKEDGSDFYQELTKRFMRYNPLAKSEDTSEYAAFLKEANDKKNKKNKK